MFFSNVFVFSTSILYNPIAFTVNYFYFLRSFPLFYFLPLLLLFYFSVCDYFLPFIFTLTFFTSWNNKLIVFFHVWLPSWSNVYCLKDNEDKFNSKHALLYILLYSEFLQHLLIPFYIISKY